MSKKTKPGWQFLRRLLLWPLIGVASYWIGALILYRFVNPPLTPLMAIRSIDNRAWVKHQSIDISNIDRTLALSVIASEDSRFCLHHGIDFEAVGDALGDFQRKGRMRGASTITMQVARNIFLWNGGGMVRKLVEAPLTLILDASWPKRRILEVYLNIAEWGDGVFGAEAAARNHFHKAAVQLNSNESARLVAVLPSPIHWNPEHPSAYIRQRASTIQVRVKQLGGEQIRCIHTP